MQLAIRSVCHLSGLMGRPCKGSACVEHSRSCKVACKAYHRLCRWSCRVLRPRLPICRHALLQRPRGKGTDHVRLTAGRLLHGWKICLPGPVRGRREAGDGQAGHGSLPIPGLGLPRGRRPWHSAGRGPPPQGWDGPPAWACRGQACAACCCCERGEALLRRLPRLQIWQEHWRPVLWCGWSGG